MTRHHSGGQTRRYSSPPRGALALVFVVLLLVLTQLVLSDESTHPHAHSIAEGGNEEKEGWNEEKEGWNEEKEGGWSVERRSGREWNGGDPFLSEEFALHLADDADPLLLAQELGLEYKGQIGSLKCHHLFRARDSSHASEIHEVIASHSSVRWFERQKLRWRSARSLPDPRKTGDEWLPSDPLFMDQWHLHYTGQLGHVGIDMNVVPAWRLATGVNVCVAIVDDGLMYLHDDLKDRFVAENSYNFNNDNLDILPQRPDLHGTMCAGATAASTNNVCGVGVAFNASVSGLRILGGPSHDAMEAHALTYRYHDNHIYSNSWGPNDDGKTLEGPGPLTRAALADGAKNGRHGKGAIYIWAAGNGAKSGDSCNYDGYASSRYVLTVGSVNYLGRHPFYSEACAAIIVSAPTSGEARSGITTTHVNRGCTSDFTGTSAAAPLVAGVAAMMLEINPNLTWRDVHHIFVRTARATDVDDPDWILNGAKHLVNHKYGFGVVDAYEAVKLAKEWQLADKEVYFEGPIIDVNEKIPDDSPFSGVVSTVEILENIILEHVEIIFTAIHQFRTDLRVVLYSPAGTPSYLSELHSINSGFVLSVNLSSGNAIMQATKAAFSPIPTAWLAQFAEAPAVRVEPPSACSSLTNSADVAGKIALIFDATTSCEWTVRVKNVQDAGAQAVLVISDRDGLPYELGGYAPDIVIPTLMISAADGGKILEDLENGNRPTATVSTRVTKTGNMNSFDDWTFSTVHLWDEPSIGKWRLEVYDMNEAGTGTFDRWQLRLYGTRPQNGTTTSSFSPSSSSSALLLSRNYFSFAANTSNLVITITVIAILTILVSFGWYLIGGFGRNRVVQNA